MRRCRVDLLLRNVGSRIRGLWIGLQWIGRVGTIVVLRPCRAMWGRTLCPTFGLTLVFGWMNLRNRGPKYLALTALGCARNRLRDRLSRLGNVREVLTLLFRIPICTILWLSLWVRLLVRVISLNR